MRPERRGDGLPGAVEWYMREVEAERETELLADEMGWRARSRRGETVLGGAGPDEINEVLGHLHCHGRMDDEHDRRGDGDRDRVEVLEGIVVDRVVKQRVYDDVGRNDEESVTVGSGLCGLRNADVAACTTDVLDVE